MEHKAPLILERIASLDVSTPGDGRNLLHAYIASLDFGNLCAAIKVTMSERIEVRLALRSRLLRLLRGNPSDECISTLASLVEQTAVLSNNSRHLRPAVDALHSAVFEYLPVSAKQARLDAWIDRGTRGAAARWLKATKMDPALFDSGIALTYWRATGDWRAAKSIAYQASLDVLAPVLPELIEADVEPWIVSKAVMRLGSASKECWDIIKTQYPATYLYLCAQLNRSVSDSEAFDIALGCPTDERGLAIWAIGQMRKLSVLDRLRDAQNELHERDLASSQARITK